MKAGQTINCLFWAILYGNFVCSVNTSSDDDLLDFDFTDLKEIDWNYDNDSVNGTISPSKTTSDKWKTNEHVVTFNAQDDEDAVNQVHPFDWREKVLRNALSKVLTNKKLRQKFVEIMPILRALSRQQRLALSAIISAQVNAKSGQELRLEQVRMMFGNDKKLLIPIIYDIANLVGGSARKYLQFAYEVLPDSRHQKIPALPQIERRKLDNVDSVELNYENIGTLPSTAMSNDSSLEDFFDDIPDDVLDPQSINEELQASSEKSKSAKAEITKTIRAKRLRRNTNSIGPTDFVHKLIRSMPITVDEDDLKQGNAGRTIKLNTTSFVASISEEEKSQDESKNTLSYQEIEDLAFASLNGTEISLSNSEEIERRSNKTENEPLPNPEELIAGPRYRIGGSNIRYTRPKLPPMVVKRKRFPIPRTQTQRINGQMVSGSSFAMGATSVPAPRKCERFTSSMCIRTEDYPLEQIMGSIHRHKNAMSALLAEYRDKPIQSDISEEISEYPYNQRRREDDAPTDNGGGTMCQSIVRYARPQKARSASGEWKYIVNTGQHTQTLRLEKCSNPRGSCSYLAQNYRSHCAQIYNYHRLLSWDKIRGLHVDIFKVPTCCSCQIDGYRPQFPPLDTLKVKDYSPAVSAYNPEPYSTINEELDYNDDEEEDDSAYQLSNKYNQHKRGSSSSNHGFDVNELQLGSKNVRIKTNAPNPTVGSYLTPPGSNEYDTNYAYKYYQRPASSSASPSRHTMHGQLERRRPYKSLNHGYDSESFGDLEFAPSEKHMDKEVNIFGNNHANDKTRQVQQKRKHIYSVPHTVTASTSSTGSSSSSHSTASLRSTFTPTHEHGQRNGHGIEYKHAEHNGQILSRSSNTAAITHQTAATIPSYYTPKFGKQHPEGGRSRIPITPSATSPPPPAFVTATTPKQQKKQQQEQSHESSSSSSSSSSYSSFPTAEATSSTTEYAVHRKSVVSIQSGYPPLYHIGTAFNDSNGHDTSMSVRSKRINYSYHPIIDFFGSNSHRFLSPSSTLSNHPSSALPTDTAYDESSPSSSSSFTRATHSYSHPQLFPHKIPKYSSVSARNNTADLEPQNSEIELNSLLQQRERRIGVGGNGGGGVDVGRVSGQGKQNQKASTNIGSNVWQPMLVK